MVNGNYRVYGETTPAAEAENRDNDARTVERKYKRKQNRSANELYKTLNMRQIDNETDSIKYERRAKEPRLLRYVSSDAVREHYVTDHLECYDEPARRHTFTKKAKNPIDGANHYTHSRSSSNCSSPTGNLPTISEHGEQYGTFRVQAPCSVTDDVEFERKLDKYFGKPRDDKYSTKVGYHGTHPDSLCRVPMDSGSGSQTRRALRLLRWPACLVVFCIALALFVYFVMPDSMDDNFDTVNATDWKANVEGEHSHHGPALQSWIKKSNAIEMKSTVQSPTAERSSTKTPEIDFYNAETESYSEDSKNQEIIPEDTSNRNVNLPIQPIFPTHISPEIQYGNEKADDEKRRTPKLFLSEVLDPDDTSENPSKPHITQKPEKPLAIYFQHDENLGSREVINLSDNLNETNENNFEEKIVENDGNRNNYLDPNSLKKDHYQILPKTSNEAEVQSPVKADVKFTSGHSKLFGISIEDAAKMQSTTPNSVYNTRVSPTLPVLRDLEDATAKYPMNVNNDGQPQCRSTRLALCRGVLPYDLASAAVTPGGIEITSLVAQLEHLIATNCSNRVQQFACALLEPECSPPPYPPRLPCYHLCTAISEDCEGLIPHDLQPVFQCNLYPRNNCVTAHSPCNPEEFQCSDGTCILKSNVCDGRFDCPAGNDEESCTNCRSDEFSCPSGGCVVRRWVCDGYTDCPNGEDESEAACASEAAARLLVGEQSEASDPAPARLPHPLQLRRPGDSDELLMTSDSGNAYRRNYTRPRPSPSRLTPYSRKLPQNPGEKLSLINDVTKTTMSSGNGLSSRKENNSSDDASIFSRSKSGDLRKQEIKTDPMNLDLLMHVYEDVMKIEKEHLNAQKELLAPEASTKPVTRFDKSIGKLQKMMKDAELMTKSPAEESSTKSTERSPIDNSKVMTEGEELFMLDDVGLVSAHASPCPSSELRCVDGRCITLAQLCDGTIDCSDHADEENCYT